MLSVPEATGTFDAIDNRGRAGFAVNLQYRCNRGQWFNPSQHPQGSG